MLKLQNFKVFKPTVLKLVKSIMYIIRNYEKWLHTLLISGVIKSQDVYEQKVSGLTHAVTV